MLTRRKILSGGLGLGAAGASITAATAGTPMQPDDYSLEALPSLLARLRGGRWGVSDQGDIIVIARKDLCGKVSV